MSKEKSEAQYWTYVASRKFQTKRQGGHERTVIQRHARWNQVKLLGQDISNIFFTAWKCLSISFISMFKNFVELHIPVTDVSQSCLKPDFPYLQFFFYNSQE